MIMEEAKYSIIITTDNSENYIQDLLWSLMEQINLDNTELIIVDNLSNDQTVPIIVGIVGYDFMNEDRIKFYINSKKKTEKESILVGKKLAKGKQIIIRQKGKLQKNYLERRGVVNDTN